MYKYCICNKINKKVYTQSMFLGSNTKLFALRVFEWFALSNNEHFLKILIKIRMASNFRIYASRFFLGSPVGKANFLPVSRYNFFFSKILLF